MSQAKGNRIEAEGEGTETQPKTRKPYVRPKITHELELETRAGSPISPPGLDILGLEPPQK